MRSLLLKISTIRTLAPNVAGKKKKSVAIRAHIGQEDFCYFTCLASIQLTGLMR